MSVDSIPKIETKVETAASKREKTLQTIATVLGGINGVPKMPGCSEYRDICNDILEKFEQLQMNEDHEKGIASMFDRDLSPKDKCAIAAAIGEINVLAALLRDNKMENMAKEVSRNADALGDLI